MRQGEGNNYLEKRNEKASSLFHFFLVDAAFNFGLSPKVFVNAVLLVGFIEEIPFRGFMLQKLLTKMNFAKANLITAFFFLSMHFPGWFFSGGGIHIKTALSVFALGYVFGWLGYKTDSLWSSIIFHSINNFNSLVIFSM